MQLQISEKAKAISPSPTLMIDSKFKQMKQQGIPVVGFGAGEPDFDTPDNIKNAAIDAINNNFTRYTVLTHDMILQFSVFGINFL